MSSFNRYTFILSAATPVSHGDVQTGVNNTTNIRLFMRAAMRVRGVPMRVPQLSENAIRSVLFRIPLHEHLLRTLDVGPKELPQGVVNLLFAGGNLAAGSNHWDANHLGHLVTKLYPSLSLLGGATDHFVLPRSKLRLAAWPLAREFVPYIGGIATEERIAEAEDVSIFDLLFEETKVRGTGDEVSGNQMLYGYETLAAGAKFLCELTLPHHAPPEVLGAITTALDSWDGYFGGQGRQGRGRMTLQSEGLPDATPYADWLDSYADTMLAGLRDGTLGTDKPLVAA